MAIILDEDEIIELTGRKRKDSQKMALAFMGIKYRERPDGSVAVLRSHVEESLGSSIAKTKEVEPDWSAM